MALLLGLMAFSMNFLRCGVVGQSISSGWKTSFCTLAALSVCMTYSGSGSISSDRLEFETEELFVKVWPAHQVLKYDLAY
jgi:uncharacterized membrane protein (DUF485 family)